MSEKMSEKYPKYFKDIDGLKEADIYLICEIFGVNDPSGCVHHAIKKLLLPGVRTGGKSAYDDIREARDTLNRKLEIMELMEERKNPKRVVVRKPDRTEEPSRVKHHLHQPEKVASQQPRVQIVRAAGRRKGDVLVKDNE